MPHFTIIPSDRPSKPAEITAIDGGVVLTVVNQLRCDEADILQDGRYAFSVRLAASGVWTIFQRSAELGQEVTSNG